jgi:hypothetical protein
MPDIDMESIPVDTRSSYRKFLTGTEDVSCSGGAKWTNKRLPVPRGGWCRRAPDVTCQGKSTAHASRWTYETPSERRGRSGRRTPRPYNARPPTVAPCTEIAVMQYQTFCTCLTDSTSYEIHSREDQIWYTVKPVCNGIKWDLKWLICFP